MGLAQRVDSGKLGFGMRICGAHQSWKVRTLRRGLACKSAVRYVSRHLPSVCSNQPTLPNPTPPGTGPRCELTTRCCGAACRRRPSRRRRTSRRRGRRRRRSAGASGEAGDAGRPWGCHPHGLPSWCDMDLLECLDRVGVCLAMPGGGAHGNCHPTAAAVTPATGTATAQQAEAGRPCRPPHHRARHARHTAARLRAHMPPMATPLAVATPGAPAAAAAEAPCEPARSGLAQLQAAAQRHAGEGAARSGERHRRRGGATRCCKPRRSRCVRGRRWASVGRRGLRPVPALMETRPNNVGRAQPRGGGGQARRGRVRRARRARVVSAPVAAAAEAGIGAEAGGAGLAARRRQDQVQAVVAPQLRRVAGSRYGCRNCIRTS